VARRDPKTSGLARQDKDFSYLICARCRAPVQCKIRLWQTFSRIADNWLYTAPRFSI
jgi:hypothetical protein